MQHHLSAVAINGIEANLAPKAVSVSGGHFPLHEFSFCDQCLCTSPLSVPSALITPGERGNTHEVVSIFPDESGEVLRSIHSLNKDLSVC